MNYQSLENEQTDVESDHLSSGSAPSIKSSDSSHIAVNPDGTLMRATLASRYNAKMEEDRQLQSTQFGSQIIYIVDDDEVIFYADATEIPGYYDDFVALFLKHLQYFKVFLIVLILTEEISGLIGLLHKQHAIDELQQLYPNIERVSLDRLFNWASAVDAIFAFFYYTIGIIAAFRRSSRFLNYFSSLSILGILVEMILAYVNRFNFVIFLLRFMALVYSRFVNQLLISVVLIPRVTQGSIINGGGNNSNNQAISNQAANSL